MGTIRVRFILVALVVSFFAVGMSAFLNYFKYKSTISSIVKSRVLLVGHGIENTVQASLQVGIQFTEIRTLPEMLRREQLSDPLLRGIDVFDSQGQVVYSSDRARVGQKVPETWIRAAERSKTAEWSAEAVEDYVAGISVKNAFDLTVGFLALRYSRDEVDRAAAKAGREILAAALTAFAGVAVLAPLALIVVIRRFERDMRSLEAAAGHLEDKVPVQVTAGSTFDSAITSLRTSLEDANKSLDQLRAKLDAAG
jgi:hypothetical protein